MNRVNSNLISELAQDLQPVRSFRTSDGMLLAAAAMAASVVFVALFHGLWNGALQGSASPFFYMANGLLVMFGIACAANVVRMASPSVGNRYSGAYWQLAMLAVFPAVALASALAGGNMSEVLADPFGVKCMLAGTAVGLFTAAGLAAWLKRGAPVDPQRAGLLTGLAAGALGSAAYGLSCPIDTLDHVAVWHMLPVVVGGSIGRAILPRLLRW